MLTVLQAGTEQTGKTLGINIRYLSYSSFSEQGTGFPLIAGYPVLNAFAPGLGLSFTSGRHEITAELAYPVKLISDDGTGMNYLLDTQESHYFCAQLDYACYFPFFERKRLKAEHALNVGVLYENRYLSYIYATSESTKDINLYLGSRLKFDLYLSNNWAIHFNFDARFYLPYLNYGELISFDIHNTPLYSTSYYAFYYQTIFGLSVSKEFEHNNILEVGVRKNDLVGYANSTPLFYMDDMVHFKLDRLFNFFAEYEFSFLRADAK